MLRRIISSSVVPFRGLNLNLHSIIFCTLARTNVMIYDWPLAISIIITTIWGSDCRSRYRGSRPFPMNMLYRLISRLGVLTRNGKLIVR